MTDLRSVRIADRHRAGRSPGRAGFVCTGLVLLIAAAALTGCKMGPDYARPPTPTEDLWRMAPATSASIANLPWWDLLKDPSLQELIRAALDENLDLRVAMASIEEFQAAWTIARFDFAPSLTYSGLGFIFHSTRNALAFPVPGGAAPTLPANTSSGGTNFSNESASAGIKWEVDLWGRIRRSIEAAKAQFLAQVENQRAVVLGLVSNVAQSYFELRALDLQVDITKRTITAWDESIRISRIRLQHGDIPKLDLDQFEAERAGTAAQLIDLEQQVVQKENQLSVLLGHRPMTISRGLRLTEQIVPPEVPPGLPSDLLQRRPDILQAEQQLAAATANIGVAQAQRFPTLSLTGSAGVASFQLTGQAAQGPFATLGAIGLLSGPILNATALGYQVKVNEARTRQTLAQYQRAVITAFQEVENALIAVRKSRERGVVQEQQVAALQSALGFAVQRYQGGRASYLDVLTAQRTLFLAELSLADTRRIQLVSLIQLYKALGGGWSPERPREAVSAALPVKTGG